MVFQVPQYWGAVSDGIQIILGLLILLAVLRNRRKLKQSLLENGPAESGQDFNVQVYSQTIKQQIDQAFANITQAIAAEQANLDRVLSNRPSRRGTAAVPGFSGPAPMLEPVEISWISGENASRNDPHEQTLKLAVEGLSARQISDKLKIPIGEVELILSLQENDGN
jgi:hypothetical protein